jgi:hypothetical protein
VLDLAARLELGATNANLCVVTAFNDLTLGKIAARLAADEAGHLALLNLDLKRPSSKAFRSLRPTATATARCRGGPATSQEGPMNRPSTIAGTMTKPRLRPMTW